MQKQTKSKFNLVYMIIRIIIVLAIISYTTIYIIKGEKEEFSEFKFNMYQLLLLFVFTYVPDLIEYVFKVKIPIYMLILYLLFIFCHFILGEIYGFYATVKLWDVVLHSTTVIIITIVGVSIIYILAKEGKIKFIPILLFVCPICFSMTIEVVWEMIEFSSDVILKTNMQRYNNSITGEPFIGQKALLDTMKDLIVDFVAATITSLLAYIDAKKEKYNFKNWILLKQEK